MNLEFGSLTMFLVLFSELSIPQGDWKAEDIAPVGELLLDISINLAKT